MPFCTNCGQQIAVAVKFCPHCGAKVDIPSGETMDQRRETYAGEIRKCPNCGEVLSSFEVKCHACGIELRNVKISVALQEFYRKIEEIEAGRSNRKPGETEQIIANIIQNYPIPNTKEDVTEFMLLASSNIEASIYRKEAKDFENCSANEVVTGAWCAKATHVYHKAELSFGNNSDFSKIREIYNYSIKNVASTKREENFYSKLRKVRSMRRYICIIVIVLIGLVAAKPIYQICDKYISESKTRYEKELEEREQELEALVTEVEKLITDGDYDSALSKAENIALDITKPNRNRARWDKIRKDLIATIETKKREATVKKSTPPASSTKLKGQNCDEIVEKFLALGFTNIKLEKIDDLVIGLFTKDGEIEEVSIEGKTIFSQNDSFFTDVPVIIKYHTFSN